MFQSDMVAKTDPRIRFWLKVDKRGPDEFWLWTGQRNAKGYGVFTPYPTHERPRPKANVSRIAHHMAYEYTYGAVDYPFRGCHHCDNPPCCNPGHLYKGTQQQNMRDMVRRGRVFHPKGELHGGHKLTEKLVKRIRLYRQHGLSLNRLARQFGVSQKLILNVVQRKAWAHVS